jgi:hypothetical protein
MNREAIIHLSNLEDTYALTDKEAVVRIRTAKNDLQAITLVYIDKYRHMFHDYHVYEQSEMKRVASDGRYDFYESIILHDVQLIDYYFRLQSADETICYGNSIFFEEKQRTMDKSFSMPAIQAEDIFQLPE